MSAAPVEKPPIEDAPVAASEPEREPAPAPAAASEPEPEAAPAAAPEPAPAPVAASEPEPAPAPVAASEPALAPVAASEPAPAPVAAPAPAPSTDIELPEALRRPRPGRVIADYFWASFLGASVGLALLGVLILLHATDALRLRDAGLFTAFFAIFAASLTLALTLGFATPTAGVGKRFGRGFATSFVGGWIFGLMVVAFIYADDTYGLSKRQLAGSMIAAGLTLFGLNLWRARRARRRAQRPEETRARDDAREMAALQRPRVGAKPYALAGLAGAGLLGWLAATYIALERNDIYHIRSRNQGAAILGAITLSIVFAAWRGFPAHLRGAISWGGRIFLTLLFGALAGLGVVIALAMVQAAANPGNAGMTSALTFFSVGLLGFGLWRGREPLNEGRRGKIELGIVGAIVVFGSAYPQSAWLRYALGSAEGARSLGEQELRLGEYERAAIFLEVACERDDVEACAKAASMSLSRAGAPVSRQRAQELIERSCDEASDCESLGRYQTSPVARSMLLSRACELGSRSACREVRTSTLTARCDNGDGLSCTALADEMASSGSPPMWRAAELWRKACELGDSAACARARSIGR